MATSRGDEPDLTLRYAEHRSGVLDVHLPPGGTGPVLLLVHGGFWRASIDRTHTRPQARALAELGHVVVTPEYRRVGRLSRGGGGGWPTTGADVRAAYDALPRLLGEAGLDAGPVTAMGHSAGGHLVLWLAATGTPLAGVVALAPVCDLREAVRLHLGGGATQALLGPVDPADADPMTLLDDRPACPVTVVHGRQDAPVPVSLSRGLVARHPWIDLVELDSDHMSLIDPTSRAWPTVVRALEALRP